MRLAVLCHDGSPLGVTSKTLWGDGFRVGLGGSEASLVTMCEEWQKRGYEVVLFNNPHERGASPFEQRAVSEFSVTEQWDILINFRSPNPKFILSQAKHKVWWSCDQYTVGDYRRFYDAAKPDKVVLISPTHAEFFHLHYGIDGRDVVVIDLPVRVQDFDAAGTVERVPGRIVWNSVPDRGLNNLWRMWPGIKQLSPNAHLHVLSDYRLWGTGSNDSQHRIKWLQREGVSFLGAVPRKQMIEELLSADLNVYPCDYEELFCISCAENQVAGAYPITSRTGALNTTNMGLIMFSDPKNAHEDKNWHIQVQRHITDFWRDAFEEKRTRNMEEARKRFHPNNIIKQWEEKVFA